ncbi:hypothetical protein NDU88_007923, partial [Pleurodeles waltl]
YTVTILYQSCIASLYRISSFLFLRLVPRIQASARNIVTHRIRWWSIMQQSIH